MGKIDFLGKLRALLADRGKDAVFPCIQDLVTHGLQTSRFSPAQSLPNRQDVTQYLAAWSRFAGLDQETCRRWLSDFAVAMLASISKSTPSGIRHSTKSNVKYIYRDEVAFACGCEANQFRARCSDSCPVYEEMKRKPVKGEGEGAGAARTAFPDELEELPPARVKERFREQFEAATDLVLRELGKGTKKAAIVEILNQQGMKTRTGREWTVGILSVEIRKLPSGTASPPRPSGAGNPPPDAGEDTPRADA
ncbi:MAG: hypothetical protein WAK57_06735 [Desulfobacterales bacterium]